MATSTEAGDLLREGCKETNASKCVQRFLVLGSASFLKRYLAAPSQYRITTTIWGKEPPTRSARFNLGGNWQPKLRVEARRSFI